MSRILTWHLFLEVGRLALTAAVALVMVMSMAGAVKPLADGLLDAAGLATFVLYTAPSMTQYAMPFAAAMGAILVYVRLAQDNEVTACQTCGLPPARLLWPLVLLGAVLAAGMLALSGWASPVLYRRAMSQVEGNIMQLMTRQLAGGEAFTLKDASALGGPAAQQGSLVLYADAARLEEPPPPSPLPGYRVTQSLLLSGVVVASLDAKGLVQAEGGAESARLMLMRGGDGRGLLTIQPRRPVFLDPGSGPSSHMFRASSVLLGPYPLPNPLRDKVDFLSIPDLGALWARPERFDRVDRARTALAETLARVRFQNNLLLGCAGGVELAGPLPPEVFRVRAPEVERGKTVRLRSLSGRQVEVVDLERAGGRVLRTYSAAAAELAFHSDPVSHEPAVRLELLDVEVQDARSGAVVGRPRHTLDGLVWPAPLTHAPDAATAGQWLRETAGNDDPQVQAARTALDGACRMLRRHVVVQFNLRLASALQCALLMLFAGVLALTRRQTLPLVLYGWCAMAAIMSIICTSTGSHMAEASAHNFIPGLLLLWTPNFLLACGCILLGDRLGRKPR